VGGKGGLLWFGGNAFKGFMEGVIGW